MRICDVCEAPASGQSIKFGWNSAFYETDLCEEHGGDLTRLVEQIVVTARRLGSESTPRPETLTLPRRPRRPDTKDVREWAKAQGIKVPGKGRVPEALIEQYLQATRSSADGS